MDSGAGTLGIIREETMPPTTKDSACKPTPTPFYRLLQAFAFDPSASRSYGNNMTLEIRYEDVTPGPCGHYVAVIDYDAVNQRYYSPVNLNDPLILVNNGLPPSDSDPRFHQQMVYGVASETIERFEFALGRKIHWRRQRGGGDPALRNKLVLMPHGVQEANAYYDPDMFAIVFGYFKADQTNAGANLPGQTIFTCLAHDIIAHETTHALLDGIRPFYMRPTNLDVAAFHEGFADIVALFQHFSMKDAVLEALRGTGGTLLQPKISPTLKPGDGGPRIAAELTTDNPLVGLAHQFGDGIGLHAPLRQAIGTLPNSNALETTFEPHDRGAILVAAVFDAFFTIFIRRTSDLWRIAKVSRDDAKDVDLHPDLLSRLADAASKTAKHFETLCIRALDYCPAVDITFGDYLRALITADHDLVRDDDLGYRAALIDAFRLRGIHPEFVTSYSEDALLWCPPEEAIRLPGLRMVTDELSDEERREIQKENAVKIFGFAKANADLLGITDVSRISVPSFHHIHRVGPDGQLLFEMVAQVIEKGPANEDKDSAATFGGVTLLFNPDGSIRYCIRKSLKNDRGENQAAFRREYWAGTSLGAYEPYENAPIDFRAIHGGF